MYTSGIFDTPCASSEELLTRACNTAAYDRTASKLGATDVLDAEPYNAANPCPVKVGYLRRVTWLSLIDAAREIDADKPSSLLALAI